ncbi:DUF4262 domain-containing protein [Mycobacterium sp. NPDC004974]
MELAGGGGVGRPHEVVAAIVNMMVPTAKSWVRRDRGTVTRSTVVVPRERCRWTGAQWLLSTTEGAAMCWQCDNPNGTTDDYLDILRDIIKDHGWAVQFVENDKRPYAYTVGLHDMGLPELLITGMPAQASARVLNSLAHQITEDGTFLQPAMHIDYQDEFLFEVVEVEHPDVHLKFAVELCSPRIRAFQLVWTDDRGRWPWDRGWSHGRCRQPVLGVRKLLPE